MSRPILQQVTGISVLGSHGHVGFRSLLKITNSRTISTGAFELEQFGWQGGGKWRARGERVKFPTDASTPIESRREGREPSPELTCQFRSPRASFFFIQIKDSKCFRGSLDVIAPLKIGEDFSGSAAFGSSDRLQPYRYPTCMQGDATSPSRVL